MEELTGREPSTQPVVTVFGSSQSIPGDGQYEVGERCGRLLAEAGFAVATGGYGGLMEAVSQGARKAGGRVIGVTAPSIFPGRDGGNDHLTEELRANSLTERIHELVSIADASIALHGSIGTMAELGVAWNLAFVSRYAGTRPKPVVAVGPLWKSVHDDLASMLHTDPSVVTCVPTVDEAVAVVVERLAASRSAG